MVIVIYRLNSDEDFEMSSRQEIELKHPAASIRVANPEFFNPNERENADMVYVRKNFEEVVSTYKSVGIQVVEELDVVPVDMSAEEDPKSLYDDVYENDVLRLLALPVSSLQDSLSRADDLGMMYLARDRESAGRNRRGAIAAYNNAIIGLGGTP